MSGRFFAVPYFSLVILFCYRMNELMFFNNHTGFRYVLLFFLVFIGMQSIYNTELSIFRDYDENQLKKFTSIPTSGIVDERKYYAVQKKSLILSDRFILRKIPSYGIDSLNKFEYKYVKTICGLLGNNSFFDGPYYYYIDTCALANIFLGQLPVRDEIKKIWRIGHFEREVPEGYEETIISGINKIKDPDLRQYYAVIDNIIRGNLYDLNRIKQIIAFHFGKYEYLKNNYLIKRKELIIPNLKVLTYKDFINLAKNFSLKIIEIRKNQVLKSYKLSKNSILVINFEPPKIGNESNLQIEMHSNIDKISIISVKNDNLLDVQIKDGYDLKFISKAQDIEKLILIPMDLEKEHMIDFLLIKDE
jgi:hypothetical protein